jgi:transposase
MKSYSEDLRKKMLNYALTHSIRETASLFKVSSNTIYLLKKRYMETGDIKPLKRTHYPERLITQDGESYIESVIAIEPDITLEKLRIVYEEKYKIKVSKGTMSNTVKRLNLTRKKKQSLIREKKMKIVTI